MNDHDEVMSEDKCEYLNDDGTCKGTPYGQCVHMDVDRKCRAEEGWELEDDVDKDDEVDEI